MELLQEVLLCDAQREADAGALHGGGLIGGQEPRELGDAAVEDAVDAGDGAEAPELVGASLVHAHEGEQDLGALGVLELLRAADEAALVGEIRAERQQEGALATKRARHAQREKAMVLLRHEELVELAGEDERTVEIAPRAACVT